MCACITRPGPSTCSWMPSGWFGSTLGSPPTGAQYQAIGPTRICDTRSGTGTLCSGHQLTSGGTLLVAVAGVGGIPGSGPVAIIANLTAVSGSQATYLTVYPADVSPKPNASDVNVNPGVALPNLVVVGLASGAHPGDLNLFNAAGSSTPCSTSTAGSSDRIDCQFL